MQQPGVRRAATIIELEDGTRMLYEYVPGGSITLEIENDYGELSPWHAPHIAHLEPIPTMTVTGILAGGTVWSGGMPASSQQGIATPQHAMTRGVN